MNRFWRHALMMGLFAPGDSGSSIVTYDLRNVDPMPSGLDENPAYPWVKSADGLTFGPDPGTDWTPQMRQTFMLGLGGNGFTYRFRGKWTYPYGTVLYFGDQRKYYISMKNNECFLRRDGVLYNQQTVTGPTQDNTWYEVEYTINKDGAFEVRWAASPSSFGVTLPETAQWTWTDPSQLSLVTSDFVYQAFGKAVSTDSGYYATISDIKMELH